MLGVSPLIAALYFGVAVVGLLVCIVVAGLVWLLKLYRDEKTDPMQELRGLEAPFFEPLCGHVTSAEPNMHNEWVQKLGRTFRFNGFGKYDYRLMTTDIRSLTHILNSPIYEKPWQTQKMLSTFLGRGVFVMEGAEHARQRKIVAPAFSSHNVRKLYAPMFVDKAAELCDVWNSGIVDHDEPRVIDVAHWLGRATLDVIGAASFNYNFNAIQHEKEEIYLAYRQMFDAINRGPSLRFMLEIQLPWIAKLWPSQLSQTIASSVRVIHQFGDMVVHNRRRLALGESSGVLYGSDSKQSTESGDLLSRLVDASTNPCIPASERLTNRELLDQINAFLFGGSDSTGVAMSWCLHFLAEQPLIQSRLREDLLSLQLSADREERAKQLDALPFLEKVVKETLRLSPPVHSTIRVATQDDIIPVSEPFVLRDGRVTHDVKIRKGSFVHIPLEGFNTSQDIWGQDASLFCPDRWSDLPPAAKSHPGLAGLMTFSFGGHACAGWKFAILEMKIFVASLVMQFVFSPSDSIARENIILQRPYVRDKWELGPRLPLKVVPYDPVDCDGAGCHSSCLSGNL